MRPSGLSRRSLEKALRRLRGFTASTPVAMRVLAKRRLPTCTPHPTSKPTVARRKPRGFAGRKLPDPDFLAALEKYSGNWNGRYAPGQR